MNFDKQNVQFDDDSEDGTNPLFDPERMSDPDATVKVGVRYGDTLPLEKALSDLVTRPARAQDPIRLSPGIEINLGTQRLGDDAEANVALVLPKLDDNNKKHINVEMLRRWQRDYQGLVIGLLNQNPYGWEANNIVAKVEGFYEGGNLEVLIISFSLDGGDLVEYTFKTTSAERANGRSDVVIGIHNEILGRQNWVDKRVKQDEFKEQILDRFAQIQVEGGDEDDADSGFEISFLEDVSLVASSIRTEDTTENLALVSKNAEDMVPLSSIIGGFSDTEIKKGMSLITQIIQILGEVAELFGTDFNTGNILVHKNFPSVKKIVLIDLDLVFRNREEHVTNVSVMSLINLPMLTAKYIHQQSTQEIINQNKAFIVVYYFLRIFGLNSRNVSKEAADALAQFTILPDDLGQDETVKTQDVIDVVEEIINVILGDKFVQSVEHLDDYDEFITKISRDLLTIFRNLSTEPVEIQNFSDQVNLRLQHVLELSRVIQYYRNNLRMPSES